MSEKPLVNQNTGDWNTGYNNSGHWNSGDNNSGYRNTGHRNSGDNNSGDRNSGYWNSGDNNSGDRNSGNNNSGDNNSGDRNSGNRNSGSRNSGSRNFGHWNTGYNNSGHWNSGDNNSGIFCTSKAPTIKIFDTDSTVTMDEWLRSAARSLLSRMKLTVWIDINDMNKKEKKAHPESECTGGYLKVYEYKEACRIMWKSFTKEEKKIIKTIPNFNADKFFDITGIKI